MADRRTRSTEETRRAIRQGTRRLLGTDGVGAVSHQRVAAVSGVSRATVYRHFGTVEELIEDALTVDYDPLAEVPSGGTLEASVRAALLLLAKELADPDGSVVIASIVERSRNSERARQTRETVIDALETRLQAGIRAAIDAGELTADDVPEASRLLDLLLGPLWVRHFVHDKPIDHGFIELVIDHALGPHRVRRPASSARPPARG